MTYKTAPNVAASGFDPSESNSRGKEKKIALAQAMMQFGIIDVKLAAMLWNVSERTAKNTLDRYAHPHKFLKKSAAKSEAFLKECKLDSMRHSYYIPTQKCIRLGLHFAHELTQKYPPKTADPRNPVHDILAVKLCIKAMQEVINEAKNLGEYQNARIIPEATLRASKAKHELVPDALIIVKYLDDKGCNRQISAAVEMQRSSMGTDAPGQSTTNKKVSQYFTAFEAKQYDLLYVGYITNKVKNAYKKALKDDDLKAFKWRKATMNESGYWEKQAYGFRDQNDLSARVGMIDMLDESNEIMLNSRQAERD